MTRVLEFWFDFASTYSYLSAMRVEALAKSQNVDFVWKPFLLGSIFAKQGWSTSPFVVYPAKGRYMVRDMERLCAERGLSFLLPSTLPARSMLANRVGLVALDHPWGTAFAKSVFHAEFGEGRDISDEGLLRQLLCDQGQDADAIFEHALSDDNKERLRQQTARAEELGLFGAPSFVTAKGEIFWGDDRLENSINSIN